MRRHVRRRTERTVALGAGVTATELASPWAKPLKPCPRIPGIRQQVSASQGVAVAAVVSVNGRPVVSTTFGRASTNTAPWSTRSMTKAHEQVNRLQYKGADPRIRTRPTIPALSRPTLWYSGHKA